METAPAPGSQGLPRGRGRLTVYLGMAPGVGKTYAMLDEAHRRVARGTDVVVGVVETHGRTKTEEHLAGLEVVPRRTLTHRGVEFTELDTEAVLARAPQVVLVDELAHTNVPGSPRERRADDVEILLAAGIDVITTVNIQHLESLNDTVEQITGVRQRETVPDPVVRDADMIQLVDMSPDALRRRLAHGNVYRSEQIDAALSSYFRPGNLIALRELALLWLADRVDTALGAYRREHRIDEAWPARERVVVAVTGGPESDDLVRRGARITQRGAGTELVVVHVLRHDGLSGGPTDLTRWRRLTEDLGGTFHTVVGEQVAEAVVDFARGVNASLVVVGVSRRGRWQRLFTRSTATSIAQLSGGIDVHLVPHDEKGVASLAGRRRSTLGRERLTFAWALACVLPVAAVPLFRLTGSTGNLPLEVLCYLALTVLVALVGGRGPAVLAAAVGFACLNWFFTPPVGRFTVSETGNLVALAVFLAVAVAVASVVDLAARRTAEALQARTEAATIGGLAQSVLTGADTADAVASRLRETFGLDAVALLRHEGNAWVQVAGDGAEPAATPESADHSVRVDDDHVLALTGRQLKASDMRVVEAFALQAGLVLEYRRLREREARAVVLERADATSTALLRAVSHDLRTPLATMRTSVDGLLLGGLDDDDRTALLSAASGAAADLQHLIDNLLDLSRISSGLVVPQLRTVSLEEVLPIAVSGHEADEVVLDVAEMTPLVVTDAGLLERVVANVVGNAVRHASPAETGPVRVTVHVHRDRLDIRVVDHGPGLSARARERMFEPFQRFSDSGTEGLGLGLAVARGLAESIGATISAEDTPGGGLTLVVQVPRSEDGRRSEP
ncbi:MAG: ATP-binding protein [Nocardioides sp.]|uniref:sensor histidine kinase n=1 Tax=Nocardioides sp. TaxID=35761 RepID=UPI003F0C0ABC